MVKKAGRWLRHTSFDAAVWHFGLALKASGLYARGGQCADIRVSEYELAFDGLPAAFDGYRILHLADLHIDALPGLADRVAGCSRASRSTSAR